MGTRRIVCENCAKEYSEDLVKCPSCDSTNLKGAQKAYLNKLADVRENLEDLEEAPEKLLKDNFKKQSRLIWKVLAALAVLAVLAYLLFLWSYKRNERDFQAQYLWQQENFPKLDALYEEGKYEELAELYFELLEEENAVLYEWTHYPFLNDYLSCIWVAEYLNQEDYEALSEADLTGLFTYEWDVKGIILRKEEFTENEYKAMEPYIHRSEADFGSRWHMKQEDYDSLYQQLVSNRGTYIRYQDCEDYIKKWIKENR